MEASTSPCFVPCAHGIVTRTLALLGWQQDELATVDATSHRGPRRKLLDWQLQLAMILHMLQAALRSVWANTSAFRSAGPS